MCVKGKERGGSERGRVYVSCFNNTEPRKINKYVPCVRRRPTHKKNQILAGRRRERVGKEEAAPCVRASLGMKNRRRQPDALLHGEKKKSEQYLVCVRHQNNGEKINSQRVRPASHSFINDADD